MVMIMRRSLAVLGLAATVSAAAAGPAAAARTPAHTPQQGSIGIRLLNAPVSERANPLARLYIIDHVAPGASLHRLIQVSNMSRSAVHLSAYTAAASIAHGQFLFAPGRKQNLMTTWVHLSRPVLPLAAGQSGRERITIRVPRNAPPGEQYGVIWAQDRGHDPALPTIGLVNRVGIRIYLSVGPGGPPPSNFTMTAPAASRGAGDRALVTVRADNTGGRALTISGTLTLTDGPGGLALGPVGLASGATIAPGQTAPVDFALSRSIPDGPWHALLRLQSGLIVRTEQATIDFSTPASGAQFPVVPAAGGSLLALIAIAVMIFRTRRPHRRRLGGARGSVRPT
jgi:hypothetical protein